MGRNLDRHHVANNNNNIQVDGTYGSQKRLVVLAFDKIELSLNWVALSCSLLQWPDYNNEVSATSSLCILIQSAYHMNRLNNDSRQMQQPEAVILNSQNGLTTVETRASDEAQNVVLS